MLPSPEITMLPLLLVSAALVAPAAPVVQGPAVEGWIHTQAGKPLAATVGLIPMSNRTVSLALKSVESLGVPSKKKPGFKLPVPKPGLYLLDVRAKGCLPLQIPVLLGEDGLKGLDLMPRPEKPKGEVKPITADAKLLKAEALYAAFKTREEKGRAALKAKEKVDWAADLDALAKELQAETDADAQGILAMGYLNLNSLGAKLSPETAALALDKLPATSPYWAMSPQIMGASYAAAGRNQAYAGFRDAVAKENPDVEVKGLAVFYQLAAATREGDMDKMKALYLALTTEYKDTAAAKSAKQLDPAKALVKGVAFPAFAFKDLDGKDVSLETFKGKLVLMDFWAAGHGPSVAEMPRLHQAYAKYKEAGFEILSLSIDAKVEDIATFRADATHAMPWTHVFLGKDSKDPIVQAVNLTTIPRPILVGPDGKIMEGETMRLRGEYLTVSIEKALKALNMQIPAPAPAVVPEAPKAPVETAPAK
ncbi:MAG: TlpA disulfide reductase family protein [Holophaga sp.]|nr:TlpA disulfide reductase family protein [Holophaga sp.]